MNAVLADIGGTHIRLTVTDGGDIGTCSKLQVADFPNLLAALAAFGHTGGTIYIATAAWPGPDGVWRFARPGRWPVNPQELKDAGWKIGWIGNDFGASARGALALGGEHTHEIQSAGKNPLSPKRAAVLGAGTGLGLAYVSEQDIHETYGGHMEAPRRTDEHQSVISLVARLLDHGRPVCAEDIISGPGLTLLYKASCLVHGLRMEDEDPQVIIANRDEFIYSHTLRLFHEFLGLFAHQAVIYGHAYRALYLDGGVLHNLAEQHAFDKDRFLEYFIGDPIPLIKSQLLAMPVRIVTDPYVALRGLAAIAGTHA